MSSGPRSCSLLRMGFRVMHPAGVPAKRWHMTLLWQRGAACRWHPCCPYGAPSLHNLSDWLSASLGAAKAGSGSPLQQPGHPFRWQQRHCCSDITAPQPGHTCPNVCERRLGGALWFLWEPLAEEGRKALQCRAGGTPGWREEGRSISFGNVGEWPFPLMRGGYLLLRPDSAIRIPSMGAASRTSEKLKSVPYVPVAAASRGKYWHFPRRATCPASLRWPALQHRALQPFTAPFRS